MSKQISYDRNQPYNQLPLLPPPDEKVITVEILQAVNKANRALAELKVFSLQMMNFIKHFPGMTPD
jgi:hypothetical protein